MSEPPPKSVTQRDSLSPEIDYESTAPHMVTESLEPATEERAPLMWALGSHPTPGSRDWPLLGALIFGIFAFIIFGIDIFAHINTNVSAFQKDLHLLLPFGSGLMFAVALWGTDRCIVSIHFNKDGLTVNALKAAYPGGPRHPVHYCVPWAQVKSVSLKHKYVEEYTDKTESMASFQVIGVRGRPYQFTLDGFSKEGAMVFVSRVQTAKARAL